jgi:hypothetical protein
LISQCRNISSYGSKRDVEEGVKIESELTHMYTIFSSQKEKEKDIDMEV